jgi:FkbM family methyltransferase
MPGRSRAARDVVRDRVFPALATYRWPAVAAYYLRKAADQQLRRRFVATYDPALNGEHWLLDLVAPHVRVAIDVGANEGQWATALLPRATALERLYCYEPGAHAFSRLSERFRSDARVTLIQAAVDERPQAAVDFFESPATQESSMHAEAASDSRRISVPAVRLDDEIARLDGLIVDLLKVDAEGADLSVLRGARRTLEQQRIRIIQFEYHRPWLYAGATLRAALDLLAACGYDTHLLNRSGLCRFDRYRAPEIFQYMNFVAIGRSHRDFVRFEEQPDPLWG